MAQQEETIAKNTQEQNELPAHIGTSKRVTDHLANERTFLAWIRTGLATITFGFVVESFGLLVRELGFKGNTTVIPYDLSSFFGVCLAVLHHRRGIDAERFHPSASFPIILVILASLIGVMLAIYLFLTG